MEKKIQRISVRNLVEFILRSGDIDNRRGKSAEREAMQEGSRMHRKIQRRMGGDYLAEVPLMHQIEREEYVLLIEGRADGMFHQDGLLVVDEIKGVYRDLSLLEAPVEVHLAQAKCYACIYGLQHGLKQVGVQMTYCNLDTEEIRRFFASYDMDMLNHWFEDLVGTYQKWADQQQKWLAVRKKACRELEFPFPYRKGQKNLVMDVYRTILRKKILFLQAPTGVGKTISTVFPAIKAVGEELGDKIFYLTAKTITRTVARDTFRLLKEQGYQGRVLEITAKEKMCLCEEMDCNPVNCPYAKGHYDRVNDAVLDLLAKTSDFSREVLLSQAKTCQVCPFELSLDVSWWSDVIICDYNYVFDPNVYLRRFFGEGNKGSYLFLVDEAHNLVERGREMYSAVLVKEDFLEQKKLLKPYSRKLERLLETCNRQMLAWKRECEDYCIYDNIGTFVFSLMSLGAEYDAFLQRQNELPVQKEVSDFYLKLRHFLNIYECLDDRYVIYTSFDGDGHFYLKLFCVNPAGNLQECLNRAVSTVFFSATLLPVRYYRELLSADKDPYAIYAKSVFDEAQRLLLVGKDVSSLYTRRNQGEYERLASYICQTAASRKGNYLVFFPSYQMLRDVYETFLTRNRGELECLVQESNMTEQKREEFIEAFSEEREKSMVAFGVLGGIFSEGIDLREEQLVGVLIVGTGLPKICTEREILKNYYQEKNGQGFAYAYQYPGMNKVLQAAGRVIRTVRDRGIIELLDERFLRRDYQELFPLEWQHYQICTQHSVDGQIRAFWKSGEKRIP